MSVISLLVVLSILLTACGGTESTATPVSSAATATTGSTGGAHAATYTTTGGGAGAATPGTTGGTTGQPATTAVLQMTALTQAFVRNFNPFTNNPDVPTVAGIYEPLMIYNTIKGDLVPWLADKYEFSADNKTLTLTLHNGVKWSDGQPFTANDVVFTFNLFKNTSGLQGSALQAMGQSGYIDSVAAQGDTTVVFTFKQANTPGLYDIIQQNIVPQHIWKDVSDPVKFTNDNPVGTGPFTQVTAFQPQAYQVDRNPNYWQADKLHVNGVRVSAYSSNESLVVAATQGKIDWAGTFIPNVQQAVLSKNADMHYWAPAGPQTTLLELNTTRKPLDDSVVRKAFSMALDRQRMVTVALSGYSKPADVTGLGDTTWKVADPSKLGDWTTYNPTKANQMLDQAGYKKGSDGIRTTPDGKRMSFSLLMVNGFSDWISAGQIMVPNLKAIGIELTQKMIDPGAYFGTHPTGDWDVALWFGYQSPTPYGFYRNVMSKATVAPAGQPTGANFARYASAKADDLLSQWANTTDAAKQKDLAQQLQQVFADEAPVIPLWPAPVFELYSTKTFTGFPDKDNAYAYGFPQGALYPEELIVMTTIKPK
jgi:peptide/nickel transport system substrate-binding protein